MRNAGTSQRSIVRSTALVLLATVMAGLAVDALLAQYSHRALHEDVTRTVSAQATQFQGLIDSHLLASTGVYDGMDTAAMVPALDGNGARTLILEQLLRVQAPAREAGIAAMAVIDSAGRRLTATGDAPRAAGNSVPLVDDRHVWLYWEGQWWLEHHVDIVADGVVVGEWIAQIALSDFHSVIKPPQRVMPGAVLAVCALRDKDYPCLSMPPEGQAPSFYVGESGLCLTRDCRRGAREEGFATVDGVVAAYQPIEAFNVLAVYSIPLSDFFVTAQWYERLAIVAVLAVALGGLWVVYLQARPLAKDLVRTTRHMNELMSKLPESVITVDEAGVIRTANAATRWMFGYDSSELIGRDVGVLMPEPQRSGHRGYLRRFLADAPRRAEAPGSASREVLAQHRSGEHFPAELLTGEYRYGDERHLIGIIRDIRQRKAHEESLRRWAHIFENAQWGIAVSGTGSRVLEMMNPAFAGLHGYTVPELAGRPVEDVFAPQSRAEVGVNLARADALGHYAWEAPHVRKDGSVFCGLMDVTAVKDEHGTVLYRVMNIRDISDSKRRELELERQRVQLSELAANREAVREQERTRIAREIHDELGQSLTSLRMKAALLGMGFGDDVPLLAAQVEEMKSLIDQTIGLVRNVATKLRPGALDLGIVSAIEWLAQDFEERTGILCGLDVDSDIELGDEHAVMVFRILQESLTNVARHARAGQVEIGFLKRPGGLRLEVRDDGVGFDPGAAGERRTFGLLGIRERAAVLGAEVAIESAPGAGVTLTLQIPT